MWRILAIVLLLVVPNFAHAANPVVPCYFVFGDSLSDVGNNNDLKTAAKANYAPYGVDFPGGAATGRFSNGRNFVDVLAELLGIEGYIPPFSNATGNISQGVNYASGAAGIRPETSAHLGDRIWLDRQLKNHVITISKLPSLVQGSVSDYLNKCLYTINIGSNDYINNYFMPQQHYTTKNLYDPEQYAGALVDQYSLQLKILHATGARKVAIFGLGLIGCTPAEIAMNNATKCVDEVNQAAQLFNQKLVSAVDDLNSQLPQAKFTFIDTFAMQAASPPGALITNTTCCKLRSDYQCEASASPCSNRNQYAFMDGFHPTEAVNVLAAKNAYKTPDPKFVHPVDISNLASS